MASWISRRSLMGTLGKATTGTVLLAAKPRLWGAAEPTRKVVATQAGQLAGTVQEGVMEFLGVPYAQPPVGKLRFRPPAPALPWKGVREASRFGAAPMQRGVSAASEDCLYLNVWAPETGGPYPVLFWMHGGGFLGGRAADPVYDGTDFAREQVVVVTVEYRVGSFGFLDVSPLLGESYSGSANHALRDLVMALEWVRENIAAFGGDPQRVTIAGQSAGGKLVDLLLGVQEAQPLFQSAMSESGGADRAFEKPLSVEFAQAFGRYWAKQTGQSAKSLETAPAETIIDVQTRFLQDWPVHFPFRPQADGEFLMHRPLEGISRRLRNKRLLIGTNRDESAFFLGPSPAEDPRKGNLGNISLEAFEKVYAQYAALYPDMPLALRRIRAVTAEEYWIPSVRVAEAACAAGSSVWMYRFDYSAPSGRFAGEAPHASEIRFFWSRVPATSDSDERMLARKMHQAWLAFLRGGAPKADGLPSWKRYATGDRATLILDRQTRLEDDPQGEERRLWDGLLNKPFSA